MGLGPLIPGFYLLLLWSPFLCSVSPLEDEKKEENQPATSEHTGAGWAPRSWLVKLKDINKGIAAAIQIIRGVYRPQGPWTWKVQLILAVFLSLWKETLLILKACALLGSQAEQSFNHQTLKRDAGLKCIKCSNWPQIHLYLIS